MCYLSQICARDKACLASEGQQPKHADGNQLDTRHVKLQSRHAACKDQHSFHGSVSPF